MGTDERTKDWSTREIAKHQRAVEEKANATEKSERDARLKGEGRLGLFKKLHAWMEGQAKSYSPECPTQAFEVGNVQISGGPDSHDFFNVSDTTGRRLDMKITSYPFAPHEVLVECGVVPKPKYLLSVGEDGNLFFETPEGQRTTIEALGSESLASWRGARM